MSSFGERVSVAAFLAQNPSEPPRDGGRIRVCVGGGAGFIGSWLAKRLKEQENCYVICADWYKLHCTHIITIL